MKSKAPTASQFFWRNQRITLGRVKDIWQKIQERGFPWLWRRLRKELRVPETVEGVCIRTLAVRMYGLIVFILSPLLFLTGQLFSRRAKTLYFFYDLDVSPITYDVADYLEIPQAERERIFSKFYKAGNAQTRGTGLGLFIAQGLVREMGGRIWVDSEEGRGSRFAFELPLAREG